MSTLNTDINLNQAPYFSDYNEQAQYYSVLEKPSVAVQAREFNVMQQMFQDQLANYGNSIFTSGTIVSGCKLTYISNQAYVKILDTYANLTALTVSSLVNNYLVSNSGLQAYISYSLSGYVVASPNLNTLYINYINTAVNATSNVIIKTFQNDEVLNIVTSANINLGQITVANSISSGNSNTTGLSSFVSVGNGVIFQKGLMLTVQPQKIIVDPYDNTPNNVSVGFISQESIVTSLQDTTLLDNAQGAKNYNAPGADRLMIVPTLITVNTSTITSTSNTFFSLIDFVNGSPSYINQNPSYLGSALGNQLATTSYDTNGNFVTNQFRLRANQIVLANGSYDTSNVNIVVQSGTAYVQGNKVNLIGEIDTQIAKGTAVNYANSQILTAQYGNYIAVKEFGGMFDPTTFTTVYLTNTAAYAVSNNIAKGVSINSMTASGVIGTAKVMATRFVSNQPDIQGAQFYVYLTNIQMTAGYQFAQVCNIYANTGGVVGVADVILTGNVAVLQNPNFSPLIYDFNQSAVKTLLNTSNTIDAQFTYGDSSAVNILTSGSASVTIPSYVGGTNQLPYGVGYLTNTQDSGFIIVSEGSALSVNLGTANSVSGNLSVTVSNSANGLYVGGLISVQNTTASQIRQVASITNSTSVNVSIAFTSTINGTVAQAYVPGEVIPIAAESGNIYVSSSTSFTINLPQPLAGTSTLAANVFYNILRTNASPAKKDLQGTTFVGINCSNNAGGTTGPWCLGFPDVVQILNVWVGSTYSNGNPNLTSNFTLVNGQRDQFYGLATMYSNNASLTTASCILVEVACFQPDVSSGAGFYSIDSYPINDTIAGFGANTLNTADIPSYNSAAANNVYFLRNCVDCRPYAVNTAVYANTSASITVNPSSTFTLNSASVFLPYPDSSFQSSLQYYMGRYDVIGLSQAGNIIINTGVPSENPVPPNGIINGMNLATIEVPPYPTLTNDIANAFDNPLCPTITFDYETNRVYTMADIGELDARLTQQEYYTSLSLLEQSAQNLLLTSQGGTTRFQQGFMADPFSDFSVANLNAQGFNCAIDPVATTLNPVHSQSSIKLKYINNTGNTTLSPDGRFITLGYTENTTPFISQPFATEEINAAQDTLFVYDGTVLLSPTGNYKPDISLIPEVIIQSNLYSAYAGAQVVGTQNETFTNIGNLTIQEFMPAQVIAFGAFGLKPSTQHWVWFASTPVTNFCAPTNSTFSLTTRAATTPGLAPLMTDATGALYGYFFVPAGTFHAAAMVFQIYDVANLVTQSQIITSSAFATFFATNIAYTEQTLTLQTVVEENIINNTTVNNINNTNINNTNNNIDIYNVINQNQGVHGGGNAGAGADPIAQSFTIPPSYLPAGVDGVFATSVDFCFATKDPVLGITLQIQELDSAGEITDSIVNDSKIHYYPSSINTSVDGSVATKFTFNAPILLQSGSSYAFILKPDGSNPNYNLYSAKIGMRDIATNAPVTALSGTGIIFTSSMGTTWSPIQTQSLKFKLRIATFNYSSGVANLYNSDLEFFNSNNIIGNFQSGEPIVITNTIISSSNASVTNNSKTITANTGLYVNNTPIVVLSATNQTSDVVLITSMTGTTLTVNTAMSFTDTTAKVYNVHPVSGNLNFNNTSMMFVGGSTSNTSSYLLTGTNYITVGQYSGAWANATLVNMPFDNIMGKLAIAVPTVTTISFQYQGVSNTYVADNKATSLIYGQSTDLAYERVVMSKSNESRYNGGVKSLTISANMISTTSYMSPVIDTHKLDAWGVYNLINADPGTYNVGEIKGVSNAINRYVSTTVALANGLNAEDLVVYVGAYWPAGSSIYVYGKIMNQYDSEGWETKAWTPMITTNTARSSLTNTLDVKEYQFLFPQTNATPTSAYDDPNNNFLVTYHTNAGAPLTDFNQFAIKIVLVGSDSSHPPLLTDYRAIAVAAAS